ncbi:MAG: hypothetical protein ABF240_05370 [Flavobacteriales bacterium]
MSKVIELRENEPDKNYWFSDDYDGIELSEKGILHPQQFIDSSLQPQVNLIPTKAVLGGTMAFGKTQVLSPKWVIAEYSDGHLWGVALFEYEVNKEGKVEFKLLSNHLY